MKILQFLIIIVISHYFLMCIRTYLLMNVEYIIISIYIDINDKKNDRLIVIKKKKRFVMLRVKIPVLKNMCYNINQI